LIFSGMAPDMLKDLCREELLNFWIHTVTFIDRHGLKKASNVPIDFPVKNQRGHLDETHPFFCRMYTGIAILENIRKV